MEILGVFIIDFEQIAVIFFVFIVSLPNFCGSATCVIPAGNYKFKVNNRNTKTSDLGGITSKTMFWCFCC